MELTAASVDFWRVYRQAQHPCFHSGGSSSFSFGPTVESLVLTELGRMRDLPL
jgi:hypothetical protein